MHMVAIFIYIILHHIILALGLASSIVIDLFIILVEKHKKFRGIEKNIMSRVMSYSFLSSFFIFIIQMMLFFIIFVHPENYFASTYLFSSIAFLVSAFLLFCTATQKYYQFKILERYQEEHAHLSDSFIKHHKEFKRTSIITFILWLILYILYVLL